MAISLRMAAPPTDDEILELSNRNPGYEFERSATGELIVTPGSDELGRRGAALVTQLGGWAEVRGEGVVLTSAGFRLPDGSLLAPHAAWIRQERWLALTPKQRGGFAPLCPDAVFEVVSKLDSLRAAQAKMHAYLANGAQLAVLIDPYHLTVDVYLPDREVQVFASPRSVPLEPVLPGFILYLEPIFG